MTFWLVAFCWVDAGWVFFGLGLILLGRALSGRFRRLDSWVVWCGLCLLVCFGGFRL